MHVSKMLNIAFLRQLCWGIISTDLKSTCTAFERNIRQIGVSWRGAFEPVNWNNFYRLHGLSFNVHGAEIALFCIKDNLTVYLCNGADGWISLFEGVVTHERVCAFFFRTTIGQAPYPVHEMIYWSTGHRTRHIRVLKEEDRWAYWENGKPLPFEQVVRYRARMIRDRVDQELIENYSREIGFDPEDIIALKGPVFHITRSPLA